MSSTENKDLNEKYSSLLELYEKVLKEKEEALEETERATISFARHFDSEVSSMAVFITEGLLQTYSMFTWIEFT